MWIEKGITYPRKTLMRMINAQGKRLGEQEQKGFPTLGT